MNQHEYQEFKAAVQEFEGRFCQTCGVTKDLIDSIRKRCEIFSSSDDFDFKGIPSNGYRSQCRLFTKWLLLANRMSSKSKRFKEFVRVLADVNTTLVLLDNGTLPGREQQVLLINLSRRVTPFLLTGDFLAIDCNRQMRALMRTFIVMSSMFLTISVPETLKCILNVRNCSTSYIKSLANNSPQVVARFVRRLNWLPVRMSSKILSIFSQSASACSTKTSLTLPSGFEFRVSPHEITLDTRPSASQTLLRIHKVISRNVQADGRILIFVHGGGFVGPSANAIDDVFIKDWAAQIPGITILNVDVSLAPEHPFPAPLQELLDLFLWLTSGQPTVVEEMGFQPKGIVLCGDSSGGNLVACLTVALNDLRRRAGAYFIQMPIALVMFVPKLSLDFDVFPSSLMSVIDPLINPLFQVKAAEAYVPFVRRLADGSLVLLSGYNKLPLNWVSDGNYFPMKSRYLSPLHYGRMEELSDINLHIMAFNFDPFLDESILLAKKWQGFVDLEIMEGVCHAGFYFKLLSSAASQASDKAVQMILRAFQLQTAHM